MGSNSLKGVSGKVIVDEKGIKDSWKEYMEKLTNEENEWDHRRTRVQPCVNGNTSFQWEVL